MSLSKDGTKLVWQPLTQLADGEYELAVEDVISANKKATAPLFRLPFRIAATETPSAPYGQVLLHLLENPPVFVEEAICRKQDLGSEKRSTIHCGCR